MSSLSGRWQSGTVGRFFVGDFGQDWYIHVYAIAPKGGGCVKFGIAKDVKKRFSGIQTGSPVRLELLGSIYAPAKLEGKIHEYLSEHRSHGEWFLPTVLVMKVAGMVASKDAKGLIQELSLYEYVSHQDREKELFEARMAEPHSR